MRRGFRRSGAARSPGELAGGRTGKQKTGQIRVYLSQRQAGHGQAVSKTASREVLWTINAGKEDQEVLEKQGRVALRQVRIQRLLDEALATRSRSQPGRPGQRLECGSAHHQAGLSGAGSVRSLPADPGNLHGIGRGQTHKAQIIGRWLRGETYDQLMMSTRHSSTSIRHYVQSFLRVVELHRQDFAVSQIAHLVQSGEALIREYLAVYAQNESPESRMRLEEQLNRLRRGDTPLDGVKRGYNEQPGLCRQQ